MGFRELVFVFLFCALVAALFLGLAQAQAPAGGAAQARGQNRSTAAVAAQPEANLAQLMRGILFPNSNVSSFSLKVRIPTTM
jgi:hypothetical protein